MRFVKTYENLGSSALYVIRIGEKSVFATYNTNIEKEYEFMCENPQIFENKLLQTLVKEESVGKLFHSSIKEGELVPAEK
tara:strand:+ start:120 stop:359 length:240 start_codon:yes stop_codon:yes gene_type:complete